MLKQLKNDLALINNDRGTDIDLMMESVSLADVRDAFLDNPQFLLLGSEDDPSVAKEVEGIPEFNEDDLTAEELHELNNIEESVENIPDYIY